MKNVQQFFYANSIAEEKNTKILAKHSGALKTKIEGLLSENFNDLMEYVLTVNTCEDYLEYHKTYTEIDLNNLREKELKKKEYLLKVYIKTLAAFVVDFDINKVTVWFYLKRVG